MRQIDEYFYDSPDAPLYHYTGIGTLLGLAEKRELRASHVNYMNDSKELTHACDQMRYIALPSFAFGGAPKLAFLGQFRIWIEQCRTSPFNLFVFSLSEEQSLLSQWRSYTPHGKGVSIGFSTALVEKITSTNNLKLGKCVYSLPDQCVLIESLIEKLWSSWEQKGIAPTDQTNYFPFFDSYRNEVLQVMALIKHDAFKEENEWRLISNLQNTASEIFFRQGEGASLLTPYIKLALDDSPNLFDLVLLGPTPHENLALHALITFLRTSQLSDAAVACEIPYREW